MRDDTRQSLGGDATLVGDESGPRRSDQRPPKEGDKLGRYILLRQVGRGAMGAVYAAYDPELDRRVALKLLPPRTGDAERLREEAQAMARLSHPNVVTVFEFAMIDHRPIIAMQLVDGGTLAQWILAKPRDPGEILPAFVGAARGLAAAHSAGIVHRDFKPSNVLLHSGRAAGGLQRVLVSDFGLAFSTADLGDTGDHTPEDDGLHLVGTPRYMAPEQFAGQRADARSDQFSFCVALHEALFGELPFEGASAAERARAVCDDRRRPSVARGGVSRRVARAIDRGLASDPSDRFSSMSALVRELDPSRVRRRWWWYAGTGVAALGAGIVLAPDPAQAGCTKADRIHWPQADRAAARSGLERHADRMGRSATELVDIVASYLDAAEELRGVSCAAYADGDLEQRALQSRLRCLEVAAAEARSVASVWADADTAVAETAAGTPERFASVSGCLEPPGNMPARMLVPPERLKALILAHARATALVWGGRHAEAVQTVDEAEQSGLPIESVSADLLRTRGHAHLALGDLDGAQDDLWASVAIAIAAGAPRTEALAYVWLVEVEQRQGETERALRFAPVVSGLAAGDDRIMALLENHVGVAHMTAGELTKAKAALLRSLEHAEKLPSATSLVGPPTNNLAVVAAHQGDFEEATQAFIRVAELGVSTYGELAPNLLPTYTNVARASAGLGDSETETLYLNKALAIAGSIAATQPATAARTWAKVGEVALLRGDFEEAVVDYGQAVELHRADASAADAQGGLYLLELSNAEYSAGHRRASSAHLDEAFALASTDPDWVMVDTALALANREFQADHYDEASSYVATAWTSLAGVSNSTRELRGRMRVARARDVSRLEGAEAGVLRLRTDRRGPGLLLGKPTLQELAFEADLLISAAKPFEAVAVAEMAVNLVERAETPRSIVCEVRLARAVAMQVANSGEAGEAISDARSCCAGTTPSMGECIASLDTLTENNPAISPRTSP